MSLFSHGKLVTVMQYFTEGVEDYWHTLYPITDPEERKRDPYLYFYDISKKATGFKGPFSDEGIYLFRGYDGRWHIHALETAQYALACWLAWRESFDEAWLNRALNHCDWLVEHQEDDGGWRIGHKNPKFKDLPTPWPSALAQGLAISALLRAYRYTEDRGYLRSALSAFEFLDKDMAEGGVKRSFEKDGVSGFVYEEYPRSGLSGVLNGYISAVLAILELCEVDSKHRDVLSENIENLLAILPLYDTGYWSLYSLDGEIDSGFYHRLVTRQLQVLSQIDRRFEPFAKRFKEYGDSFLSASRALLKKVGSRL